MEGGVTTIGTIGDLLDHGYAMWATCLRCGTRRVDLALLAARYGRAASYIRGASPIRMKCARCGASCPDRIITPGR